jgi:hypothetical protein
MPKPNPPRHLSTLPFFPSCGTLSQDLREQEDIWFINHGPAVRVIASRGDEGIR